MIGIEYNKLVLGKRKENKMIALLEKLLPVLLVMTIGWLLRKKHIISSGAINELKNIIVNVALPCILFLSFAQTTLEARYILVVVIVFGMCGALYAVGYLLSRRLPSTFGSIFTPWFMAGFEFGMIGIGLFGALWGTENLPLLMLIGLGHEFFAWFVCIPYIQFKNSGKFNLLEIVGKFLRTPVILGIFGGLIVNAVGLFPILESFFWGRSVISAMTSVSNIAVPLILMIVGYSLVFEKSNSKQMAAYLIARIALVLTIGTVALVLIKLLVGDFDPLLTIAFYAFVILPPSYLVPIMVKNNENDRHFFSQAVVYYTLISFAGYIVLMLL